MGGYFCVYSKISGLYLQRLVEFLKNSFECKIFKEDCQKNVMVSKKEWSQWSVACVFFDLFFIGFKKTKKDQGIDLVDGGKAGIFYWEKISLLNSWGWSRGPLSLH